MKELKELKGQIIAELLPFIYEKTGRRPIIMPVLLDVKKQENYFPIFLFLL